MLRARTASERNVRGREGCARSARPDTPERGSAGQSPNLPRSLRTLNLETMSSSSMRQSNWANIRAMAEKASIDYSLSLCRLCSCLQLQGKVNTRDLQGHLNHQQPPSPQDHSLHSRTPCRVQMTSHGALTQTQPRCGVWRPFFQGKRPLCPRTGTGVLRNSPHVHTQGYPAHLVPCGLQTDCSNNPEVENPYRGTSLIRKRTSLGPYRRPMSRVLGGSQGGGHFLMCGVP